MPFIKPSDLPAKEPRPGWLGRFFNSEHITFAYYDIAPGATLHLHHHPNEEVWHVIEGSLEVVIGETSRLVHAGEAAVIPADVEHSTAAAGACRAIVVDFPLRTQVGGASIT